MLYHYLGGLQFCSFFEPFTPANYSSVLFLNPSLTLPPHVPTAQSSCKSKVHNTFDDEILSAVRLCPQLVFVVQLKSQRVACPIFWPRAKSTLHMFNSMCYFSEEIASGKHIAQTAHQPLCTDWWVGWLKGQTKWWTLWFERVFCSFIWLCYINSKLTVTAAGRNSLSSLSEREFVTPQCTILFVQGNVRSKQWPFEWPGTNIQLVELQVSGKHSVA